MSAIIIYFSRSGNNYVNGSIIDLPVGNTQIAANNIRKITGADIFKVEQKIEYSKDYSECIEEAKCDLQNNKRPQLKAYPDNFDEYDTVYLGYPNYWGTMPMPMFTLLEKYDWSGKIIKPFCTNEGSGMGSSESDIKKICHNVVLKKGLAINGANINNSYNEIEKWVREDL